MPCKLKRLIRKLSIGRVGLKRVASRSADHSCSARLESRGESVEELAASAKRDVADKCNFLSFSDRKRVCLVLEKDRRLGSRAVCKLVCRLFRSLCVKGECRAGLKQIDKSVDRLVEHLGRDRIAALDLGKQLVLFKLALVDRLFDYIVFAQRRAKCIACALQTDDLSVYHSYRVGCSCALANEASRADRAAHRACDLCSDLVKALSAQVSLHSYRDILALTCKLIRTNDIFVYHASVGRIAEPLDLVATYAHALNAHSDTGRSCAARIRIRQSGAEANVLAHRSSVRIELNLCRGSQRKIDPLFERKLRARPSELEGKLVIPAVCDHLGGRIYIFCDLGKPSHLDGGKSERDKLRFAHSDDICQKLDLLSLVKATDFIFVF